MHSLHLANRNIRITRRSSRVVLLGLGRVWDCPETEVSLVRNIDWQPLCQSDSGRNLRACYVLPVRRGWITPFWSLHDSIFAFRELGTAIPFTDIFRRSIRSREMISVNRPRQMSTQVSMTSLHIAGGYLVAPSSEQAKQCGYDWFQLPTVAPFSASRLPQLQYKLLLLAVGWLGNTIFVYDWLRHCNCAFAYT